MYSIDINKEIQRTLFVKTFLSATVFCDVLLREQDNTKFLGLKMCKYLLFAYGQR